MQERKADSEKIRKKGRFFHIDGKDMMNKRKETARKQERKITDITKEMETKWVDFICFQFSQHAVGHCGTEDRALDLGAYEDLWLAG